MYAYCGNNPINMIDSFGYDPIPIWAQRLVYGSPSIEDYIEAMSADPSAWAGRARIVVSQAIEIAEDQFPYMVSYAEHKKKGTTNPANRNNHEKAETRRMRDQGGEKKNQNPNWKPNPNKRKSHNATTGYSLEEKVWSGVVAIGATAGLVYFVVNDASGVGAVDDSAIAPLIKIIWDNAAIAFA